ncbi:hypothetical protein [Vibrio splendidus]|uniref:hypothetical protein n=1 Tax=Vibrio splendidus TaxID=29497 RepID=UPI002469C4AC|nr:hypothetical protein [Vibrio splendidus]MDH6028037.1 hypothetical protein [Vibrio splendidus]
MKWNKLGNIYKANPVCENLLSHSANPLPILIGGDLYRVFFNGRNSENKSSLGYFDFNIETLDVVNVCEKEVIKFGDDESYYSHGISIGNDYKDLDGNLYILFMAWQIRGSDHWRGDIGRIVVSSLDELYIEDTHNPFIGINDIDKMSLSYPWVYNDGEQYSMIYGSTVSWKEDNGEMLHVLNFAESSNGHQWEQKGLAIPYELGKAQAFSRPTYVKINDKEHLWFSYRSGTGEKYRIGHSLKSESGLWQLNVENPGIDVSQEKEAWDSEMICYPSILKHKHKTYMFYNGNGFGKSGIGLAVLEE